MARVHAEITIEAPVATVFEYVNDFRNVCKYTADMLRWDPVTKKTTGLGARFEAEMQMGPTRQGAILEITGWKRNALIKWDPVRGFDSGGEYKFASAGRGATDVSFEVYFNVPGGIAGKALGKVLEPIARLDAQKSVENLKREVEGLSL